MTQIFNIIGQSLESDKNYEVEYEFGNSDSGVSEDIKAVRTYRGEVVIGNSESETADKVFEAVEQMPQFPGGDTELMNYIDNHINYPTLAAENGIQGCVVVKFVVKADGSIGEIKVVRSKDPDLDKEAVRVVKTMPKFIPGQSNGQPVNVWFTLPVKFKLREEE